MTITVRIENDTKSYYSFSHLALKGGHMKGKTQSLVDVSEQFGQLSLCSPYCINAVLTMSSEAH